MLKDMPTMNMIYSGTVHMHRLGCVAQALGILSDVQLSCDGRCKCANYRAYIRTSTHAHTTMHTRMQVHMREREPTMHMASSVRAILAHGAMRIPLYRSHFGG